MEAIAVLSVAAAAIQFVDFGGRLLSLCREIRDSAKGTTKANEEIEASIEGLKEIQKLFKPITVTQGVPQQDVDIIEKARQDFDNAANDLLKQLQDLKKSRSKWLWGDIKAAYRVYRARKKIETLVRKLESRNERFQKALSADTRNRVLESLEEQKKIKHVIENSLLPKVENLRTESEALHANTRTDISSARMEIAAAHGELGVKLTAAAQNQEASGRHMEGQLEEARTTAGQRDFLATLAFPDMSSRYEKIGPTAPGTFEWIFEEERLPADDASGDASDEDVRNDELRGKFRRWLISDGSIFWISGKPGSGKSSLMHFIENDERLERHLKQWSGGRSLTMLQFFFWRPGSDLQKSIAGMLRSLLHQSLRRKPLLIDEICAQNPGLRHSDWSQDRLVDALKAVLTLHYLANDFVFILIDGLDELEGNHLGLLSVICQIERMESTKVCLSSRPEPVFQSRLHAYPTIRLEDLNFRDIKKFVNSTFAEVSYPHLRHIDKIAYGAQGMFLWAALVSRNIMDGFLKKDDESTLRMRINAFPQGLEPLFASLFSGIDKHHQDFLVFIFQILKDCQMTRVDVALVTACLHHTHVKSVREFLELCHEVQQQVTLRSMGLVEVNASSDPRLTYGWALQDSVTKPQQGIALEDEVLQSWADLAWPTIDWLHRSAYDYIFGSPEADLPGWVRNIDIAQDVVGGTVWLFRYGPVIGIWHEQPCFWRRIGRLAKIIGQTIQSHSHGATNFLHRTLDELCRVLQISLLEGSPLDLDLRQKFNIPTDSSHSQLYGMNEDFWVALLEADLHDYIISSFGMLKSSRFAHPTCGALLDADWKTLSAPLMGIILDFLLAQANSKTGAVPQPPKEVQAYKFSFPLLGSHSVSWLSHGELLEPETIQCFIYASLGFSKVTKAVKNTRLQSSDFTFTDVMTKVGILTDKWQIFRGRHPGPYHQDWPLAIHFPLSTTVKRDRAYRGDVDRTRLRLTGFMRSPRPHDLRDEELAPVSVFHPSQATCITLNAFLKVYAFGPQFAGTRGDYSKCRDVLIEDIRADTNAQLDAWQQLYLLACIRTRFFQFWSIKGFGVENGLSDRRLGEPRITEVVPDESKNES